MELLVGKSLLARMNHDRMFGSDERVALSITGEIASALEAAHRKHIVHRDLKPDNVFLVEDARAVQGFVVKILDFGIAKLGGDIKSGAISHKTRTGTLMGTPLYMSPEQCLGVREVDRRSDIYSLGCILYEMLCGAPPFVSEGFGALVNMHINQPPEPPSKHSPQISPGVERLVLKMLAKNADERFQSMDAVREALGVEIARAPTYRPGDTAPPEERPRRYSSSATTLSEAAAVAAGTVPPRGGSRRALGVGAIAVAIVAVVAVAALRRGPSSTSAPAAPPPPPPVLSVTPAPAPAAPAVPAPAAAAATAPAAVEVVLDSNPEGALVSAEGVAIGTTPMKWQVAPTGNPRTLTFKLAGYRTEIMQANPAAGLRLRPTLERQAAHRSHSKPSLSPRPGSPVDDIKSER